MVATSTAVEFAMAIAAIVAAIVAVAAAVASAVASAAAAAVAVASFAVVGAALCTVEGGADLEAGENTGADGDSGVEVFSGGFGDADGVLVESRAGSVARAGISTETVA